MKKEKLNILYLVSTLEATGPTNQLSYIIRYLDRERYYPVVLTLSAEPKKSKKDYYINDLGVEVISLNLSRLESLFFANIRIKKILRQKKIDLIHSQGIRSDIINSKIKIPKVFTLRNYPYEDYPAQYGKILGSLMARKHLKIIKKNLNNFYACSKTVRDKLAKKDLPISVVQNGVDTSKYFEINNLENKKKIRSRLGISQGKTVLIVVGPLISRKNNTFLVESFMNYSMKKEYMLLFLGDGIERDSLEAIANGEDNIQFCGNVENVRDYLWASDVLLSSSLSEGLPNSVLEGMSCGLPTLLSNISSHKELYSNSFSNYESLFFKNNDQNSFYKSLDKVVKNYVFFSELSLEMIRSNFSANKMSEEYQKIYCCSLNNEKC